MTGEPDDADSMVEPVGAELDRLADVVPVAKDLGTCAPTDGLFPQTAGR
jgi:hypothetical protein